jgi:putative ABC transport system substrate-binding protein
MTTTHRRGIRGTLRPRLAIRLCALVVMTNMAWAVAAADVLAVVPDVREPYRSVLSQILDGIRKTASVRLVQVPAPDAGSAPLLTVTDERVVIALGSTAVEAAGSLSARLPVVTGAIVTPTGQPPLPGISLESDPGALFRQLLSLRPGIRTVHWLYRPARSGWLLERAQAAARKYKLKLDATATEDARSAAQRYQEILNHADSATEAVWLSQDPALVSNDSTLPDILNRAWANNIVVFSGSVQHVAHGVLFALYPDNEAMGIDLAKLALALASGAPARFEPNRGLRRAINRRTAEHLNIRLEPGDYDLVLPAR